VARVERAFVHLSALHLGANLAGAVLVGAFGWARAFRAAPSSPGWSPGP
jgi:hypothetical protein